MVLLLSQNPPTPAPADVLGRYTCISSHQLHRTNEPGILSMHMHPSKVWFHTRPYFEYFLWFALNLLDCTLFSLYSWLSHFCIVTGPKASHCYNSTSLYLSVMDYIHIYYLFLSIVLLFDAEHKIFALHFIFSSSSQCYMLVFEHILHFLIV